MQIAGRKKHRSAKRDAPRMLSPPSIDESEPITLPAGSIGYGTSEGALSEILNEASQHNQKLLRDSFPDLIEPIERCIDRLHSLAAQHAWALENLGDVIPHKAHELLFSCFHKSLLNIYVAKQLTLSGLYGVARPQLRQALEYSLIAKICATDPDSEIYDKWIDGLEIYLTNGVIKRVDRPDMTEISKMWSDLSDFTHATVHAAQWDANVTGYSKEAFGNLAIICIILNFQHHLLSRHIITPSARYYAEKYGSAEKIRHIRTSLKSDLKAASSHMSKFSRSIVRAYRAPWSLKRDT